MIILKRFVPYKFRIYYSIFKVYYYDLKRYFKYSAIYTRYNTQLKLKSFIIKGYHVVEKGLTMPNVRLGFGKERVFELVNLCHKYQDLNYDCTDPAYIHAISVLNEYLYFHEKRNFVLDDDIMKAINILSSNTRSKFASEQRHYVDGSFFNNINESFEKFALSRRSVRNFTDEDISSEIFKKCIELSLASPSPCNRQPNRVYIIKNKDLITEVLKLQNGNRGFGHLGNALVVFTSDVSLFHDTYERNEGFLNSGKFIMSFIFGLHYYEIGSCCLNWSVSPKKDILLRKLLSIPDREAITMTLICGKTPDEFYCAQSPKENWENVSKFLL